MTLTRGQILKEQIYNEDDRNMKCEKAVGYQEERAFVNRVKKKRPEDLTRTEIQVLFRVAESGLETRFNLSKAISQVKEETLASEENGTNLDGFRIGYIHKKTLELLEYIKGGF